MSAKIVSKRRTARRFTKSMREKMKTVRLITTAGDAEDLAAKQEKKMCIMQLIAYLTGQVEKATTNSDSIYEDYKRGDIISITDRPICVSPVIAELGISANDYAGSVRSVNQLLDEKFVAKLMNTAPLVEKVYANGKRVIVTDKTDPEFKRVEKLRREFVKENNLDDIMEKSGVKMSDKKDWLLKLANMGRFTKIESRTA